MGPARCASPTPLVLGKGLDLADVRGLGALRPLDHVELHALTLGEAAEALGLDGGVMDEHVRSAFTSNEPKTLGVVEPLHCSGFHVRPSLARLAVDARRISSSVQERDVWKNSGKAVSTGERLISTGAHVKE